MSHRLTIALLAGLAGAAASVAGPVTSVDLIAYEGMIAPNSGGLAISSLNAPFTNGLGQVGFTGNLDNGAGGTVGFVWIDNEVKWMNTDGLPDVLAGAEGTMGFGNNGEFIYSPSVNSNDAVWTHEGVLLQDGDAAPGLPGQWATFNSRPIMTPDGTSYWIGGLTNTQGGSTQGRILWKNTGGADGTYTALLRTGDSVGGFAIGTTGIGFAYDAADNNNHYITFAQLTTGSTATDGTVLVNGAIVARESLATGQGDNWSNFDGMSINNAGNYVFGGDTAGDIATDEFIAYNGQIAIREGDSVGGVTLGTSQDWVSINNDNNVAFIWDIAGGAEEGLFWADDAANMSAALLLLATGSTIDTDGDNTGDAVLVDFNASATISPGLALSDHPWVFVEVDLMDVARGVEYEAIIRVRIPAPGAVALMGVAGLAGLRRRR